MIKNIKRINTVNIHNKKYFLEKFMNDLNNKKRESIKKKDIDQRNSLAGYLTGYKKLLLLLDNEIPNCKYSFSQIMSHK